MSTRVTIAGGRLRSDAAAELDWHVYRDVADDDGRVRVALRGLLEVESGSTAGEAPWVGFSVPAVAWWGMVRALAEARVLGRDHGEGLPSGATEAAVLDPSWALLADHAGTTDLRTVAHMTRDRAAEVLWLRSTVERALREGTGVLSAACAEALLWGAPPAAARDAEHQTELLVQGTQVARTLRVTLATDAAGVAWLLTRWSPRLRCTALEALRRGDTGELRRMLDETAAEADRFA